MRLKKIAVAGLIIIYWAFCLFASFTHIHSKWENHHILINEDHHNHSIFYELFHAHIIEIENTSSENSYSNEHHSSQQTVNYSAHYPYQYEISIQNFSFCFLKLKFNLKKIDNFIISPELPPPKPILFSRTFINLQSLFSPQLDISKSSGLSPPNLA